MGFLLIFKKATLMTQGHNATISDVLFQMDLLVHYFKNSLVRHIYLEGVYIG
jgi:hypothetical protein